MTLVVDASAVAEILFGTEAGRRAAALFDGHELLAPQHNISACDAMYVVLAWAAQCSLLTLDARLAASAPDCALLP